MHPRRLVKTCLVFFSGGYAWAARASLVNHISVTTLDATNPSSNRADIDCIVAIDIHHVFVDVDCLCFFCIDGLNVMQEEPHIC